MEYFLLLMHCILGVFFFLDQYILIKAISHMQMLIFILYIIFMVLPVLIKHKTWKLLLQAIGTAGLFVFFSSQPFLWILLPFHITRILIHLEFNSMIKLAIIIFPAIFSQNRLLCVVSGLLCWLISEQLQRNRNKIMLSESRIDELEKENHQISRKLSQAREWEQDKEYYIKLEERKKISQKLHDEIGHTISGSLVQLQAAQAIIDDEPGQTKEMLSNVNLILSQGMNAIRRDLQSLKPAEENWGLQKIKNQLGEFRKKSGIQTHFHFQGQMSEITRKQWQVIDLNLIEALTNIIKHSGADRVDVEIHVLNKVIKTAINDNGRGRKNYVPGMGLTGMEDRTQEAKGTLIVDAFRGFSIVMIFQREK